VSVRKLAVAFGFGAALCCGFPAFADSDFCSSETFRQAFLEGQNAVDFPSIGPKLTKLGDATVPCLRTIANVGGVGFGITECKENLRKCRAWAILGLSSIGTSKARGALLSLLASTEDPVALAEVMSAVTSNHMSEAIPHFRKLLKHKNPYVRGEAILDLGALGSHSDFEAMVAAAYTVIPSQITNAVRGLELLGDPRAVDALDQLKLKVSEPTLRAEIQRSIDRIRSGKAIRPGMQQ
jgi:hypothetical protein